MRGGQRWFPLALAAMLTAGFALSTGAEGDTASNAHFSTAGTVALPGLGMSCIEPRSFLRYRKCSYFRSRSVPMTADAATARIAPLEPRIGKLLFPLIKRSIRKEYEGWMRSLEDLLSAELDERQAADDPAREARPAML